MGLHAEAQSTLSILPPDDTEAIAIRAQTALDRSDQDEAERLLAASKTDDPLLARLRGRLALSKHDAHEALHHFQIAFAADPASHETIFGLIGALVMTGDHAAADRLRESAGNLERLNTLIHRAAAPAARRDPLLVRQLGAACAALHRDAEARAWYALAVAADPLDSESQRALFRLRDTNPTTGSSSATRLPPDP
jgi:hypothetical protein